MCYFDLASDMNVVSLVLLTAISDFHYPLLAPYNYHHNLHLDIQVEHAQAVNQIYYILSHLYHFFCFSHHHTHNILSHLIINIVYMYTQ